MSFEEFCQTLNATPEERQELALYLGFLRLRKTLMVCGGTTRYLRSSIATSEVAEDGDE